MSSLTWLASSEAERKRTLDVIHMLGERQTIDSIGIGLLGVRSCNPTSDCGTARRDRYAAAVVASLGHQPIQGADPPEASAGAEALEACAFLQAVKCAPPTEWRKKSEPTGAMTENCPREYLLEELALLAPGILIVLGDMVAGGLRTLRRTHDWSWKANVGRGLLELDGSTVEVLHCRHPSSYGYAWRSSYADLVASVQSKPLALTAGA